MSLHTLSGCCRLSTGSGLLIWIESNSSFCSQTRQILHQTNPGSLQGRSFLDIAQQEGLRKLYRGALWTALRNAPGSFALFGGNALVKEQVSARARVCVDRINRLD